MPTGYTARLAIDPALTTFTGVIAITGEIANRAAVIWLHGHQLDIKRATATKGTATVTLTAVQRGEDMLEIRPEPALEPGTWVLNLEYAGTIGLVNTAGAFKQQAKGAGTCTHSSRRCTRGACFRASTSQTRRCRGSSHSTCRRACSQSATRRSCARPPSGATTRFEFARTKPLPSYLVAFGVGPFDIIDGGKTKSGLPVRILTMKGRTPDAAFAAKSTARILDLLEEWFAIPIRTRSSMCSSSRSASVFRRWRTRASLR